MAKLIDPHSQRGAHLTVEFLAASRIMFDQEIQLRAIAKHSEDDFRSEAGIARIERRRAREQQVRSVAARLNL